MTETSFLVPAAHRVNGPGRTVWLASYPKSGNTWVRAIVTALNTHQHLFAVNQLGAGQQPHHVTGALSAFGVDVRWLSHDEIDRIRTVLTENWSTHTAAGEACQTTPPGLRKTHEVFRNGLPGREPFPVQATRAAILVVRDPRDVACSYAPFFGVDLDEAVDALCRESRDLKSSPARGQTAQPWGSWSSHAASWLADDVPFPVHLVRFEDLLDDAPDTLLPVFQAIGLQCTRGQLETAVERAQFERLRESESQHGFRETSKNTEIFFRKGRAGGWRDELSPRQVAAVEADHASMMVSLGYQLTTAPEQRAATLQSRESRRRAELDDWMSLPETMNLKIALGEVPESIVDARRPRRYIQVNDRQVLVTFGGGAKLLVEDGERITIQWTIDPQSPNDDPSWLVQGWAVTVAMLQRGDLSLHAATVRIGDEIVAIAGDRGAGKSTTAMALRKRGHDLLIDDVTLIELRDGQAWTTPYPRNVHLLPDAAEALGVDFDALPMLSGGRTKVAFRAEDPPEEPHRIDRIVVLVPGDDVEAVTMDEARGGRRLAALLTHTRRDGLAPLILGQARYFELVTQLSIAASVCVLRRPKTGWTLDEVLDLIEGG